MVILEQRPEYGGAFTFQGELLRAFSELSATSRHEFVVLCPTEGVARFAREQIRPGAADIVVYEEPPRKPAKKVARRLRLIRREPTIGTHERIEALARANGVQFIWSVSHGDACYDTPYMTIVWDLEHRRTPWFPEIGSNDTWQLRERAFSRDLPRASVVIAGTDTGKREIERYYGVPAERIKVLPHPTPSLGARVPMRETPLPFEKVGRPFVFYPAQFWAHKNQANLVRAMAELRGHGLDLDVALVGSDKGNRRFVETLARQLGISARVHFLGFVDESTMVRLYRRALALTYVSFCGPENLPPLEAFSLGCPVVAADIAGAREQLGEGALFVDPADPVSIARGIRELHEDAALRDRLKAKGASRAAAWTPQRFVQGVFSILDDFEMVRRAWE